MLFRVALAVAVLVIFVYGLVDVIRTDARLTRGISKPAWIIVMIVLPVIGAILWLLIGRPRNTAPARRTMILISSGTWRSAAGTKPKPPASKSSRMSWRQRPRTVLPAPDRTAQETRTPVTLAT
jgi:hypothetical protein